MRSCDRGHAVRWRAVDGQLQVRRALVKDCASQSRNRMVTQGVEIAVSLPGLLIRCSAEPFVFALDGGDPTSWATGRALLGFRPRATLRVAANGDAVVADNGEQPGRAQRCHGDPFVLLDR